MHLVVELNAPGCIVVELSAPGCIVVEELSAPGFRVVELSAPGCRVVLPFSLVANIPQCWIVQGVVTDVVACYPRLCSRDFPVTFFLRPRL